MTEATVTTLTAEVRTLVVGSRQITLSAARQLDTVPLAELEVMGRVKLAPGIGSVIGRHLPTGVLALARYFPEWEMGHIGARRTRDILNLQIFPKDVTDEMMAVAIGLNDAATSAPLLVLAGLR